MERYHAYFNIVAGPDKGSRTVINLQGSSRTKVFTLAKQMALLDGTIELDRIVYIHPKRG